MFALVHEGLKVEETWEISAFTRWHWVILIFFMLLFSTLLSLFEIFNEQDKSPNPHLLAHSPSLIHPHG